MKFISLFSGIGGFDLGFEAVGMKCVAQVEIDEDCLKILNRHWKGVKKYHDIKECGRHNLPTADLICGGFPCQDLSIAGGRKGLAGERSGLWWEFARVIDEVNPQWVVIENVPGFLSSNKGKDFAVVIRWLAERGYGVAWRILDSQYFGVPQRRRRVFLIGSFADGRASQVLFESESSPWDTPPSREERQEPPSTFTIRTGKDGGGKGYLGSEDRAMTLGGQSQYLEPTVGALQARDFKGVGNQYVAENKLVGALQSRDYKGIGTTIDDKIVIDEQAVTATLRGFGHGWQGQHNDTNAVWEMSHSDEVIRENGEIAPTLQRRMGTGGNQVPMVGVRRLTPVECERLQGFPDGFTEGQSDTARYRQLGNAVTVSVIKWIGKRIKDA